MDQIDQRTGFWESLKALPSSLLGSGMAQHAAQAMQSRPYMLHVQEARAMGQQPMPYEMFIKQQLGLLAPQK